MARKKKIHARFVAKGPARRTSSSYGAQMAHGRGMVKRGKKKMSMDY